MASLAPQTNAGSASISAPISATARTRESVSAGDRFLDAFAAIERVLRRKAGAGKEASFSALVERVARHDHAVGAMAEDLREFAELRNAIVHERGGGYLIAEPYESTVERLDQIRRLLERPAMLGDLFRRPVELAAPEDAVGRVAQAMRDGNSSQMPIYDGKTFTGLLTAETVTRWLAAMLASGVGLVEEAPVSQVLSHTEDPEHHCQFVARTATAFDALAEFGESRPARLVPRCDPRHRQRRSDTATSRHHHDLRHTRPDGRNQRPRVTGVRPFRWCAATETTSQHDILRS
jgi:predicted transcriptional regulator